MRRTKCLKLIFLVFIYTHACLVKQQTQKGSWESNRNPRKIKESCSCGKDNHFSWGVQIIANFDNRGNKVTCTGTIVTSNLIATSHKCFIWNNQTHSRSLNIFEMWGPAYVADIIATPEKLEVYSFDEKRIVVDRIIYHPRYIEGAQAHKHGFFEYDIALLRIKQGDPAISDIIGSGERKPMCIPTLEEAEEATNSFANYFNAAGGAGMDGVSTFPGKYCEKTFTVNDTLLSPGPNTFCLKYIILTPNPGDPIYVKDKAGSRYLTGITSWSNKSSFSSDGIKFAYFTHAKEFIKYIEQQAAYHKSSWCKKIKASFTKRPPLLPDEEDHSWHSKKVDVKQTLDCACGHSNTEFGPASGRIMNGVEATPYEFGWMVLINIKLNEKATITCGGSIINDRTILTAGHCTLDYETLMPFSLEKVSLYAHIHKLDPAKDLNKIQLPNPIAIHVHPAYIEIERLQVQLNFDIALIILKDAIKFPKLNEQKSDSIVPICLPMINSPITVVGKNATVAGWGLNDTDWEKPNVNQHPTLQKLSKPILSLNTCKEHMPKKFNNVYETFICGSIGIESSTGQGDSGGPLIISEQISGKSTNHWIQVGLLSYGQDTRDENKKLLDMAIIYTNIQKHLSFINFYSNKHGAKWCKFE